MSKAAGAFDVTITPQAADRYADAAALGRMTLDKTFHGDLEATGQGQMLTGMGAEKGSAAYVAMEQVTGRLHGRSGSFILQHTGVMNRGVPHLTITVVPDSGTGELVGLSGTMTIDVEGGTHAYALDYTLSGPA